MKQLTRFYGIVNGIPNNNAEIHRRYIQRRGNSHVQLYLDSG